MKTYLVPTDYSETAHNAAIYAINLAKKDNAKIVLFNVFQIPYPVVQDTYIPLVSIDELRHDAKDALTKYKNKLLNTIQIDINVECQVAPDFINEGINKYIKSHPVDLIVMGITGGSVLKEILIGSNVINVVRHCKKNVLIVPKDAKFKEVKKIGFATTFDFENEGAVKKQMKKYTDLFQAKLIAIHVNTSTELNTPEKRNVINHFNSAFSELEFSVKEIVSENVAEEIENYVQEKNCDWLALVPKHTNLFERLFNKTITKKLAFHLHVPILAIHDEEFV